MPGARAEAGTPQQALRLADAEFPSVDRNRRHRLPIGTTPPDGAGGAVVGGHLFRGELSPRALCGFACEAALDVVVYQAHRLPEGVDGRRPDEAPAALLQVLRQLLRVPGRRHLAEDVPGQPLRPRGGIGLEPPDVAD